MRTRKRRPRKYIPFPERLAAALAMLLPAAQRDAMRAGRLPAKAVLKMFHFDHVALHSLGGEDKWWNLSPIQVRPHREKSRRDTSIVAKVDRIVAREGEHREAIKRMLRPGKRDDRPVKRRKGRPIVGSVASGWKRKFNGEIVRR